MADNAILYSRCHSRKFFIGRKVDTVTGAQSTAVDAISYNTFKYRKKVYPITGKVSNADHAISQSKLRERKRKKK
jgi:hypothetical protein